VNIILWVVTWGLAGWLVGLLAYFTLGLFTLPARPELRNRAANYYSSQAMKLLGRAALVERGTKFDIFSTSHDAERNVDEIEIDGKTGHISNEAGLLSTFHKQPFGLVPPPEERVACYVSPEVAEVGKVDVRLEEQGSLQDDSGEFVDEVSLDAERPLVGLREAARRMIPGSRSIWDVRETVELYKQSQSGFTSPDTVQFMILIVAYGAGALLTWLIVTNAGGAAPTGISLPGI